MRDQYENIFMCCLDEMTLQPSFTSTEQIWLETALKLHQFLKFSFNQPFFSHRGLGQLSYG